MAVLDTQVLADPASSRQGADYLHRLAEANHDAATAAHKARSLSEPWQGEAAEAFRHYISTNAKDTDELVEAIREVSKALQKFAEQVTTTESRMGQARQAARDGQLVVTGLIIHQPKSDPTDGASQGMGTTSLPGLNPKADKIDDQWAAWHEAEGMVNWARNLEATAHKELNAVLTEVNGIVASLQKATFWIGNVAAFAGGLQGAATKLQSEAAQRLEFVKQFEKWASDSSLPAATRQAHISKLMTSIGLAEKQATSNARALAHLGETKVGGAVFNPLTKTLGGTKPGVLRSAGRMGSVFGFVLAGFNAGKQIIFAGEPVWKTIRVNFVGWGVGSAVGGGVALLAGAAGVSTAPVTITAVGVGSAVTWGYNYFQENDWGDFTEDVSETAQNIWEGAGDIARGATEWMTERWGPGATPPMGR